MKTQRTFFKLNLLWRLFWIWIAVEDPGDWIKLVLQISWLLKSWNFFVFNTLNGSFLTCIFIKVKRWLIYLNTLGFFWAFTGGFLDKIFVKYHYSYLLLILNKISLFLEPVVSTKVSRPGMDVNVHIKGKTRLSTSRNSRSWIWASVSKGCCFSYWGLLGVQERADTLLSTLWAGISVILPVLKPPRK